MIWETVLLTFAILSMVIGVVLKWRGHHELGDAAISMTAFFLMICYQVTKAQVLILNRWMREFVAVVASMPGVVVEAKND